MNAEPMEKLIAVRLERAGRYEKASKQLIKLAWSIEIVAVIIGLSIAFSRVADANQAGSVSLSFWSRIQLMGGFLIVSMGELTKIPLSLLLVNVRPIFKPIVFLVVAFISAITFETVFLSLERGYNYQKSDIQSYRDKIESLEEELDTNSLLDQINSNEVKRQYKISQLKTLNEEVNARVKEIEKEFASRGESIKPAGFENSEKALTEIKAMIESTKDDYAVKIKFIDENLKAEQSRLENQANTLLAGTQTSENAPETAAKFESINKQIASYKSEKSEIIAELSKKIDQIQKEYDDQKKSFDESYEYWYSRGNLNEANRYLELKKKLAPATLKKEATDAADIKIAQIDEKLKPLEEKLTEEINNDLKELTSVSDQTKSQREAINLEKSLQIKTAITNADRERLEAKTAFEEKIGILQDALQVAEKRFSDLNAEWQNERTAFSEQSDVEKKNAIREVRLKFSEKAEEANLGIENLGKAQDALSERIVAAEQNAPNVQKEIAVTRQMLCASMLNNQIFRISTRFNTAPLFGVEQNATDLKLAGGPDPDCPSQPYVDEANADRVAFIWFGSIALLAATAGAATAITSQAFLRMAETLRWQPPTELGPARRPFLRTLRLAIVNWRWKRVRTVEVERIKEVPVDVVRNIETVREVEHVVHELVPVPVFVPTGGNVENEIAKVRAHYEQLNRLSRDAIMPPEPTFVTKESSDTESKPPVQVPSVDTAPLTDTDKVDENPTVASLTKPTDAAEPVSDENEDKKV